MALTIEEVGNSLVINADGDKSFAYPISPGMWLVSSTVPGPDPDPDPQPGGRFMWPFGTEFITSDFRPPNRPTHDGIDFAYPGIGGVDIPAAGAGTVTVAQFHTTGGWGFFVVIDHGDGLKTLYAHMLEQPSVTVGQAVTKGQTIGKVGNTGASQGNHLHFETRVNEVLVNPHNFMIDYS